MSEFEAGRQLGREDREGECQFLRAEIERLQAQMTIFQNVNRTDRDEIERLRMHIRAQAEDIITLGQMVGRCCPVCDRRALADKEG